MHFYVVGSKYANVKYECYTHTPISLFVQYNHRMNETWIETDHGSYSHPKKWSTILWNWDSADLNDIT